MASQEYGSDNRQTVMVHAARDAAWQNIHKNKGWEWDPADNDSTMSIMHMTQARTTLQPHAVTRRGLRSAQALPPQLALPYSSTALATLQLLLLLLLSQGCRRDPDANRLVIAGRCHHSWVGRVP